MTRFKKEVWSNKAQKYVDRGLRKIFLKERGLTELSPKELYDIFTKAKKVLEK